MPQMIFGNAIDEIIAGSNDVLLSGGSGKDTILGGQGCDLLNGGTGNVQVPKWFHFGDGMIMKRDS